MMGLGQDTGSVATWWLTLHDVDCSSVLEMLCEAVNTVAVIVALRQRQGRAVAQPFGLGVGGVSRFQ